MKTYSRQTTSRLFQSWAAGAVLALLVAASTSQAEPAAGLLERGIYNEETKGDLAAATQIYQEIIYDPTAERSLAAQAQLRLGLCELKLGNKPLAIAALERLTDRFPDKDKLLAIVGNQLPELLEEMVKHIEQNYIREVDRSELMQTAISAIVGKLDATGGILRTNDLAFLGTNEVAEMTMGLEQKLAGIGAQLRFDKERGALMVDTPLPNSPAIRGGLAAGDRILRVDGKELPTEKTLEIAVSWLRGRPGTDVTLEVKHANADTTTELKLTRDTVRLPSVLGDHYKPDQNWDYMLDENQKVGYLRLTAVGQLSAEEMENALKELTSRGMRGLILDLRGSPGGLLDGAVSIADLFVEHGRIVTFKSRDHEQGYDAKAEGTYLNFPMVVLVNRHTASAAEIIAACLQDHERATVIGERTFGQAVVKSLIPLKGGIGALKLPTGAYYRPSGKNMNRYPGLTEADDWGVTPTVEVSLSEEEFKDFEKYQNSKYAIGQPPAGKGGFQDRQLQKAVEYLNGN